ncbi:MAG: signal peptidase I [Clostridium sp.]|nr:signal peptidase I [Clostridium sp.]
MIIININLDNKLEKYINITLAILLVIYIFINNSAINSKLALWTIYGTVILIIMISPVNKVYKRKVKEASYTTAFIFSVSYIVLNIVIGFITGFGTSPYDHSLFGVTTNVVNFGIALVASELIRSRLVNSNKVINKRSVLCFVIIIMSLTEIRISLLFSINTFNQFVVLLSKDILPILFKNIFASYLVLYGGAKASLIYLLIIQVFELFFPILPDMNWLFKVTLEVGVPLVGTMYINSAYIETLNNKKRIRKENEKIIAYLPTIVISVFVIWFVVGVFEIYPTAIVTGSMEPVIYPGDVVLVNKLSSIEEVENLQVGDIIQFKREDIIINHRITEIIDKDGQLLFRTKGDNNSTEDTRLVKVDELKGEIVKVIPKIGLITMFLKSDKIQELMDIEF